HAFKASARRKRYGGRTVKKSEGIRKKAILARGKLEPKYLTIQYPILENKKMLAYKAELEAKKKRAS
ncbi:hypothetical protein, partial [uncultured Clostridium sp.]|uniref:hypothetical protein n=1 Tax=uncultured Clostridium sp. TaxID=59620 RepID=UPI0025F883D8